MPHSGTKEGFFIRFTRPYPVRSLGSCPAAKPLPLFLPQACRSCCSLSGRRLAPLILPRFLKRARLRANESRCLNLEASLDAARGRLLASAYGMGNRAPQLLPKCSGRVG